MKQYRIFRHPNGAVRAVKQGWSWPAFLLVSWWALVKRLWWPGIGSLVVLFAISLGTGFARDLFPIADRTFRLLNRAVDVLGFAAMIAFGMWGNHWLEKRLIARGYRQAGTVRAAHTDAAVGCFLADSNTTSRRETRLDPGPDL